MRDTLTIIVGILVVIGVLYGLAWLNTALDVAAWATDEGPL